MHVHLCRPSTVTEWTRHVACIDFLSGFLPCSAFLPACSNWDGMYVLFTYAAKRQTARSVQLLLSNPEAGSEDKILRHITFCRM